MDSLRGRHRGLKSVFQSYLCEEWKERHSNAADDFASKFLDLHFFSLELPQQENFYDCGLFVLHYVERFLKEAPIHFNPFKITKFSNFLKSNWFPPPEASLKRSHIQNLIYDILNDNSPKASADCIDNGHPFEEPGTVTHKAEADSPGGSCYPALWHGKNPSSSTTELETCMQFTAASPARVASCLREPGLDFSDLQGAAVSLHSSNCQKMSACHQRGFMSPTEETEESGEETALALETENSQVAMLASDVLCMSYISSDHKASETLLQGLSVNSVEIEGYSYPRTSTSVCWNTLETGAHEDQPLKKTEGSNIPDKTEAVVQDSQEASDGHDVDVSVESGSSFQVQGNQSLVIHPIFDLTQNTSLGDDTSISKKELQTSESDERDAKELPTSESDERDAKRPKLMSAASLTGRFTRSMSKNACLMPCE